MAVRFVLLFVAQSASRISAAPPQASPAAANPASDGFVVQVGSSAPHQVTGGDARLHMTLTNYPITGPVFSGPHQDPFVCTTTTQVTASRRYRSTSWRATTRADGFQPVSFVEPGDGTAPNWFPCTAH